MEGGNNGLMSGHATAALTGVPAAAIFVVPAKFYGDVSDSCGKYLGDFEGCDECRIYIEVGYGRIGRNLSNLYMNAVILLKHLSQLSTARP